MTVATVLFVAAAGICAGFAASREHYITAGVFLFIAALVLGEGP